MTSTAPTESNPTTDSSAATSGRGGREGRVGRGRQGGRGRRGGQRTQVSAAARAFKGSSPEMNGHVFQCFNECETKNQFNRTVEALGGYIAKTMKFPADLASLTKNTTIATIPRPAELTAAQLASPLEHALWKKEVDKYSNRVGQLERNLKSTYAVIWGQCSDTMKSKLKAHTNFTAKDLDADCEWILKEIKAIMTRFEGQRNYYLSINEAYTNFFTHRQAPEVTLVAYLESFQNNLEVLEHYGGIIGAEVDALASTTGPTGAERLVQSRNKAVAMAFLKGADRRQYGVLWNDLENQHARGNNQYPEDLTAAYGILTNFRPPRDPNPRDRDRSTPGTGTAATTDGATTGLTFTQATLVPGDNGVTHVRIECRNCNAMGHYASNCPSTGIQLLQNATTESPRVDIGFGLCQVHSISPGPSNDAYRQADHMVETAPTEFGPVIENDGFVFPKRKGFMFTQLRSHPRMIPNTWVLLDSQSTVSVFCNKDFLTNIRPSDTILTVYTNGGTQVSNQVGDVRNFGPVWYNPKSIANILSFAEVRKKCRITTDTAIEAAILVHKQDGSIMKFKEFRSGLYYYEVIEKDASSQNVTGYMFVNTVAGNKLRFHRRDIDAANKARALLRTIGHPSQKQFEDILRNNLIRNCPVTIDDARRALEIYGPDQATLKGKTTKGPSSHVVSFEPIPVPTPIIDDHGNVTLCIDFFYVQGQIFLHTISRKLQFRTVQHVDNRSKKVMLPIIQQIIALYHERGFNVTAIHADNEFECLRDDVRPTEMNITAQDDHVGEVERSIRTIKERVRADVHGLPFNRLPKMMIVELVRRAASMLNMFPAAEGISNTLSPLTIIMGRQNPDYNAMKIDFGTYAQVFEDNNPSNTNTARTTGAIALNPTGNAQGDVHFLSLTTWHRLSRSKWTALPMPDNVIDAVQKHAETERQPLILKGCPKFEWRPNVIIDDDDDDVIVVDTGADVDPDWEPNEDNHYDDVQLEVDDEADDDTYIDDELDIGAENGDIENNDEDEDSVLSNPDEDEFTRVANLTPDPEQGAQGDTANIDDLYTDPIFQDEDEGAEDSEAYDAGEADEGATVEDVVVEEAAASRYNLRGNKRDYSHRYDFQMLQHAVEAYPETTSKMETYVHGFIMQQMSATAGIKKHGEKAVEAIFKEFSQLDDKTVFKPMKRDELTKGQRRGALHVVNLIKEKKDGTLKGRTCADRRHQRTLFTKAESASPTVSNDALMLTLMVDALEKRDVATADVVGAYLWAEMDDFVLVKLTGESVKIMCDVNPKYKDYVTFENGKWVLYLQLLKALYGCIMSALLWYRLFSETLKKNGFVLNPYDSCIANKTINGAQCTVGWHVDDNKISHIDTQVVTGTIEMIEKDFGKMVVTRGKKHVFLGMDIEFCDDGCLKILMKTYLEEAIEEFGEPILRSAVSPARKDLFDVDAKATLLPTAKREIFHSIVAKLLYVSHRGRPDIQPTVAFLCTRVSCSTEQDWSKLLRLLQFIKGTIEDKRRLGADDMGKLMTWVDAAYGVHHDMKSHTGGMMSLGTGIFMGKSSKQKLNTKSSTEAELVGATDYLPNTIWAKMFLEGQGFVVTENVFAQDNLSAMKLKMNGRASSGQKTRHISIRFFFMEDRVKTEKIAIIHCPTDLMLADFNTKPLQGSLFTKFRRVIMGYDHSSTLRPSSPDSIKERVGNPVVPVKSVIEPNEQIAETYLSVAKRASVSWPADVTEQSRPRTYGAKERIEERTKVRRKISDRLSTKRSSVFLK